MFVLTHCTVTNKKQTNSVALSPRANYTDWSTAHCTVTDDKINSSIYSKYCGNLQVDHKSYPIPSYFDDDVKKAFEITCPTVYSHIVHR
jgi:hypothetical protein